MTSAPWPISSGEKEDHQRHVLVSRAKPGGRVSSSALVKMQIKTSARRNPSGSRAPPPTRHPRPPLARGTAYESTEAVRRRPDRSSAEEIRRRRHATGALPCDAKGDGGGRGGEVGEVEGWAVRAPRCGAGAAAREERVTGCESLQYISTTRRCRGRKNKNKKCFDGRRRCMTDSRHRQHPDMFNHGNR